MDKTTLGLNLPTDPRWVNIAEKQLSEILIDHAYCEQKAASSSISLIIQFSELDDIVDTLTPIVAEEWDHFQQVLSKMKARGISLGPKRKDEYVAAISKIIKTGGSREQQLVEKLLFSALIEARSCERFKLLWKNIGDEELAQFYHELMISEAGHYHVFLDLAKKHTSEDYVQQRWQEFLVAEAEVIKNLEVRSRATAR